MKGGINFDKSLLEVESFYKQYRVPIILGCVSSEKYQRKPAAIDSTAVSLQIQKLVMMIDLEKYHKRKLLPFAERIPLKGVFPWPK